MCSQTTTNYLSTNVQQHIVNKYWSYKSGSFEIGGFYFGQEQWWSFINKKRIGGENYYFTSNSCSDVSNIFDNSKIGTISSENYIKTINYCYLIEISTDLQKIRIKKSYDNDTKWQTFYLMNNPFTNTLQSGAYTKNNCPTGGAGSIVPYTVVAGKYISNVSQADADAQAQAEITANGQNFANANGACP